MKFAELCIPTEARVRPCFEHTGQRSTKDPESFILHKAEPHMFRINMLSTQEWTPQNHYAATGSAGLDLTDNL